jgi:Fe-S-cluster containining protein
VSGGPLTRQQRRALARRSAAPDGAGLTARLHAVLANAGDPQRASRAATMLHEAFERRLADAGGPAVACRKGCDHCCHGLVAVLAGEVFRLGRALRRLPADGFAALRMRIAATDAVTRGRNVVERGRDRTPCPLLADGGCSVYADRPLACRAMASLDADACRAVFGGRGGAIPIPDANKREIVAARDAAAAASSAAGIPMTQYELVAALRIALDDPEAEARWLKGEDVLAPARLRPVSPLPPRPTVLAP